MVWDEVGLVTERRNGQMVSESELMMRTLIAFWDGKKGGKLRKELLDSLNSEMVPHALGGHQTDEGITDGEREP
jgi:hypothetical protein